MIAEMLFNVLKTIIGHGTFTLDMVMDKYKVLFQVDSALMF